MATIPARLGPYEIVARVGAGGMGDYLNPDSTTLMVAAITTDGTSISAATPRILIKTRARGNHYPGGAPYDVARGGRILVNELVAPTPAAGSAAETSSFTVVLNFLSALSAAGSQ